MDVLRYTHEHNSTEGHQLLHQLLPGIGFEADAMVCGVADGTKQNTRLSQEMDDPLDLSMYQEDELLA